MNKMNSKNSLAAQISSFLTAPPTKFGSDDESDETKAQVVEQDESEDSDGDLRHSNIRKRNVDLLDQVDERYKGKKVSRKDMYSDAEESDDSDVEAESENESEINEESENEESENEASNMEEESNESDGEDNESDDSESESLVDTGNPLLRQREDSKIKTVTNTNVRAEIQQGNCVREQISLWESLLEMRIKLQKCLIVGNQLPQHDIYQNYSANTDFTKETENVKSNLSNLLNNMLLLQSNLITRFPETKDIFKKTKKRKAEDSENDSETEDPMDEEIPSDFEGEEDEEIDEDEDVDESDGEESETDEIKSPAKKLKLSDYEKKLADNHKLYTSYRNSVIQKWNDKTRVSSGNLANKKNVNQPILKQIEYAIGNKTKLLQKTQLKRSEYEIVGKTVESSEDNDGRRIQEYDTEIYDDDDFYHQLLQELIQFKSADITDPIQLSKQWIQLQNMRKKMKRKIDTRATKGRRLRYGVHQKLVNYMAPITVHDTWTNLQKDELYSSLFGKIKSVTQEQK